MKWSETLYHELPNKANDMLNYNRKIKDVDDKTPDHAEHITRISLKKQL